MGVRRYRSIEDMPPLPPRPPLDPDNLRLALGLSDCAQRLRPFRARPGVRKHRSYDEMVRARDGEG